MNDVVTHKCGCTCSNFLLVFTLLYLEFVKKRIYKEKTTACDEDPTRDYVLNNTASPRDVDFWGRT